MHSKEKDAAEPYLTAYRLPWASGIPIVPAPVRREWMSGTQLKYAGRCLPLLIGNQSGWWVLNTQSFSVRWNGGDSVADLDISYEGVPQDRLALSHFGHGILTFYLPYLFRTPPGWNLLVRGPANFFKDGASPLDAVVETDWAVATFAMNWKITRPDVEISFPAGDPIVMLVPQRRGDLELFQPGHALLENTQDAHDYQCWAQSREEFAQEMTRPGTQAAAEGWQRHYMRGTHPGTAQIFPGHQSRLHLRGFADAPVEKPVTRTESHGPSRSGESREPPPSQE